VVPFAKDDAGYDQLLAVIERWSEQIRLRTFSEVASLEFIDRAIDGQQ
jgi:hypothetical protein